MKTLKNINGMFLAGALSLLMITSCKKDDSVDVQTTGSLRIVNAFEGSVNQDFYQGTVKLASNVAYSASTTASTPATVKAVAGMTSVLSFTNTGTTTVSTSAQANLITDATYTVFYTKKADGSADVAGFAEDNTATATGKAKVRFVNLGYSLAGSISVTGAAGASIASGILLKAATTYQSIDPGVDLTVSIAGSAGSMIIPGSTFQSGKIYTVWFDNNIATTAKFHVIQQN